ncbi:hypothetical protein SAMN05444920_12652 [Nonomuraea solani]|uniref:Uncharacterized protein n=1 Tax=Nonomuraea solani TaxID=1144553 RepID=A0A1H6F0C6_9ACTN|nr:hypothetical protein [Nonomuraea solani]SEH02394.1 hypothetical protein SAMN05444920_12652 [Nonomuraea solani]
MARAQEPQTMGHEQEAVFEWAPHRPSGGTLRVSHTSCCGRYEWGCEGGSFFVLRSTADGYQETGRGRYRRALDVYIALAEAHNAEHVRRGETPEPDTFLAKGRRG